MYWRYTREDVQTKLRLFLGEKQAMAVQEYQCISLVAGQLFGSEKKKAEVDAEVPQTAEQMQTAFSSVFGK